MPTLARHELRTAALVFLAWTVVGLFFFSQGLAQKYVSHEPTPWWHYLLTYLTGVYLCALLTPVVLWLGRRFPIERRNWLRRSTLHFLFSLSFSGAELTAHSVILHSLGLFPTVMKSLGATVAVLMIVGFHQNVASYWTILGVQYGLSYYRRYREREQQALRLELHASELKTQLAHAQLNALKMQLQPHFLFNTLNAIMVLVRQQRAPEAEEMLARLSDLLRLVLEDVEAQEVSLLRELEYLKLYLAIEQVRFADRLRVHIHADPVSMNAAVPHLALQPIVENAIRHGIGRSSSAGNVHITAAQINDTLEITVSDDGPGFPPLSESLNGHGIGLSNTRGRLYQLYGDAARLLLENGSQGGALITMSIPFHLAPDTNTEVLQLRAVNDIAG